MTVRTVQEALAYADRESKTPSQDWQGWCLQFVRTCYGIGPGASSAYAAWLAADDNDRHPGDIAKAPVGAALIYKGAGPFGHITLAAPDGKCWTNDLVRDGKIDLVDRDAPTRLWGQKYLGYLTAINGVDLPLGQPPRPAPIARWRSIAKAIDNLKTARVSARRRHDQDAVVALTSEIRDLKVLLATLRKDA